MIKGHLSSTGSRFSETLQPLAIVLVVMIVGASLYLWRGRYIRSRAALITIAAIVAALIYVGLFMGQRPG